MIRKRYPLNGLRAFEAAARHMSFVKAAEELHVTPAAISHQVKGLEEVLGVLLFHRLTSGLLLTDIAQRILPAVGDGFDRLGAAVDIARNKDGSGALMISVAPAFVTKWLVPRLEQFNTLFPEIDLRISSKFAVIDFRRDTFDAAIRFGRGRFPGLKSVKLFDEWLAPMCSPRLLEGDHPLRKPEDLSHHILLHDESLSFDPSIPSWKDWLTAAGVKGADHLRGPHFSQLDHAFQAAIDGAGVVLGLTNLAAADLAAKRLVQPFELMLPVGLGFYLVYPRPYLNNPKVAVFQDWLIHEISETRLMTSDLKS